MCIVSANVATMAGGAMNETSALKGGRLHQIAIQNKLPTVTFVQSVRDSKARNLAWMINTCRFDFRLVLTCNNSSVCSTEVVLVSAIKLFSKYRICAQ